MGRSNQGVAIDSNDILLLEKVAIDAAKYHDGRYHMLNLEMMYTYPYGRNDEPPWRNTTTQLTRRVDQSKQLHNIFYIRVGMFRSGAMFLTPIDHIASLDRAEMNLHNQHAVLVPSGKHQVNDRMIYGPSEGVIVWATKRFELIEMRLQLRQDPGFEMNRSGP